MKGRVKIFLVIGTVVTACALFFVTGPRLLRLDSEQSGSEQTLNGTPRGTRAVYVSPEESFSVQLPEGITLELQGGGPAVDPFLTVSAYSGSNERGVFIISVYDILKNPRREVSPEAMIRDHARALGVTLTSLGTIHRKGLSVSRAVGRYVAEGQQVIWVEEARIHGDRAFLLVAGGVDPAEDPDVETFFESFTPLVAPTNYARAAGSPATTGETTTVLSIMTDGRLAIDGRSFRLPCERALLAEMIGPSSREWVGEEYGNTIHTWDDLGIRTYEKTGTGIVTQVNIDLLPGKYDFSPERAYNGSLTVDGVAVDATTTPVDLNASLNGPRFSRVFLSAWSCQRQGFTTTLHTEPNGAIASVAAEAR